MPASPPVQPNLQFARTLPGNDIVNPVFSDVTVSNAPMTQNFGDEETTGIVDMEHSADAGWYDLSGRKLPAKPVAEIAFSLEKIWLI